MCDYLRVAPGEDRCEYMREGTEPHKSSRFQSQYWRFHRIDRVHVSFDASENPGVCECCAAPESSFSFTLYLCYLQVS